jgi:arylsulfatase
VPAFAKDGTVSRDELWWFHSGNRALRQGDWKLVSEAKGPWELYNLAVDRGESHNLAAEQPERVASLGQAWQKQLEQCHSLVAGDTSQADR